MDKEKLDQRLKDIVENRLLRVPKELKRFLPPILYKEGVSLFRYMKDTYLILAFIDPMEKERIEKLMRMSNHPFPGLIKENNSIGVAFKLERSRNIMIERNTVKNLFSFSLGKDVTLILRDHRQSIRTKEFGVYEYVINLAYIISFGDEINRYNVIDFVEDLIAYSFKQWESRDVGRPT